MRTIKGSNDASHILQPACRVAYTVNDSSKGCFSLSPIFMKNTKAGKPVKLARKLAGYPAHIAHAMKFSLNN